MMTGRFQIEQLAIEHVRNERKRMPVVRGPVHECARYMLGGNSRTDERTAVNVNLVVVVDEIVADGLAEHDPDERDERGANRESNDERR